MKLRKFKRGDNFFFQMLNDASEVILESQSYTSKDARDNGIESVRTNIKNTERYDTLTEDGKHFFTLRAGNNQEIARSVGYDSAADMQNAMSYVQGGTSSSAEYSTDGVTDDYKPIAFYEERSKDVADGFATFEADGEFYFCYNIDGVVYMISEGYKSQASRDNGISSVEKNMIIDERYEFKQHANGMYYFNLKAGNNQEIATSRWLEGEGLRAWVVGKLNGKGGGTAPGQAIAAVEKPKKKRKKRAKKPKVEKVVVATGAYPCSGITYQIFRSGNDKYYFTYRDENEKAILISSNIRGFNSEDDVKPIIEQIAVNGSKADHFEEKTTVNDKFYYYLKNDDGKNIGKSFFFDTQEEMRSAMKLFDCGLVGASAPKAAAAPAATKSEKVEDDYLACKVYKSHINDKHPDQDDFIIFTEGDEHYFAWVSGDDIVMRSEGYTTEKARENGIQSVIKNRELEERFSVEEKMGYHFTVLKAGNHQEIARSCPEKDKARAMYWFPSAIKKRDEEAKAAVAAKSEKVEDDYLACKVYKSHINDKHPDHDDFIAFTEGDEHYFAWVSGDDIVMRSEGYTTEKARENGIQSVIKNRELEERFSVEEKMGYHFTVLKAGNHQEIARSCPEKDKARAMYWFPSAIKKRDEEAKAAVAAAAVKTEKREDDYLHCSFYEGKERSEKYPDFSLFERDGEHYFALLDNNGDVVLRSEGYKSEKGRENGIQSVIKNKEIEKRWSIDENRGVYFHVLKAGNHQEIGRSCPMREKPAGIFRWGHWAAPAAAAAVAAVPKAAPEKPKDKEDDYLACKEYEGRVVNDKVNRVALFKHEGDSQYYFALYDENNDVKLRSEGFRTAKERDEELSGVLKYHDNKDMYKRITRGKYYMDVLYDKTGREVGRSCLKTVKAAAPIGGVAKAATVAAAATAVAAAKPEKKVVASAAKAAPVVEESGGGFKWWWLLPLLLLPLLWFLCNECKTETPPPPPPVEDVTPPPAEPEPVAEVPEPEPEPEVEQTPSPVVGCQCDEKNISIFNVPSSRPVSIDRLGTLPEFGNSHGLTPAQFYSKLSDRYSSSAVDRAYLDYVFRSMGYPNGFRSASASLFSNATLDRGQSGLLGFGTYHGYGHYALNTSERDRQAFLIKAANGCDVHFMKTCGNYMFFCE